MRLFNLSFITTCHHLRVRRAWFHTPTLFPQLENGAVQSNRNFDWLMNLKKISHSSKQKQEVACCQEKCQQIQIRSNNFDV